MITFILDTTNITSELVAFNVNTSNSNYQNQSKYVHTNSNVRNTNGKPFSFLLSITTSTFRNAAFPIYIVERFSIIQTEQIALLIDSFL